MAEKKIVISDGGQHSPILNGDTIEVSAVPVLDNAANLIQRTVNGLSAVITTQDTNSVQMMGSATMPSPLAANVKLSAAANNQLSIRNDGMFVPLQGSALMNAPRNYIQPTANTVTITPQLSPNMIGETHYMYARSSGNQIFNISTSGTSNSVIDMYKIRLILVSEGAGSILKFSTRIRWLDGSWSVPDTTTIPFPTSLASIAVYDLNYSPRTIGYFLQKVTGV